MLVICSSQAIVHESIVGCLGPSGWVEGWPEDHRQAVRGACLVLCGRCQQIQVGWVPPDLQDVCRTHQDMPRGDSLSHCSLTAHTAMASSASIYSNWVSISRNRSRSVKDQNTMDWDHLLFFLLLWETLGIDWQRLVMVLFVSQSRFCVYAEGKFFVITKCHVNAG